MRELNFKTRPDRKSTIYERCASDQSIKLRKNSQTPADKFLNENAKALVFRKNLIRARHRRMQDRVKNDL